MPLPNDPKTPWPPAECEPVYTKIAEWAAWYAGDIEQLSATYSGRANANDNTGFSASEKGGFKATVGRAWASVRRWFWGSRPSGNQQRSRLHVPLAADIAAASADLLYSEPPTITADDDATQTALDALMDDGAHATLLEAAEVCAALGGVYLRVLWDDKTRAYPWFTAVHPDAAIPEWRWGDLYAVTFWREVGRKGKFVYRHLERHEPGVILHGLYQGDEQTLGIPISLADNEATAWVADVLSDGNEIQTGTKRLTAVYIPNMKPNRLWRNDPHACHYGRSDYAGVEPLMDALDMVQSSWMRDVDLGKARLIVPHDYMRNNGTGQGASVDLDQEVYEGINAMGEASGKPEIKEVQFAIRVEEHSATCDSLKATIVTTAGYSPQTFGLGDSIAMTATEVAAKQRRSFITRDRKIRYHRPKLGDVLETWIEICNTKFAMALKVQRPQVTWADAVSVDPKALAEELNLLEQAKAISTEQKVRRLHPDWDDDEVAEEVEKIDKPVENPDTFTGEPGDQGEPLAGAEGEGAGYGG